MLIRDFIPGYRGNAHCFAPCLIDFYKVGHVLQYPVGTQQVWSNWTPRSSRVQGVNKVVLFGLQYFLKRYFREVWYDTFFSQKLDDVLNLYAVIMKNTLGVVKPKVDHLVALHDLGYMPLDFYAIPEGFSVDLRIPAMVITNTKPEFFWLPNYMETLLSSVLWKPSTSATTAQQFRRLFVKHAIAAGEKDLSFIDWQGHDFSFRGMSGVEDAILSGMGHLLSFSGTDTIPAILAAAEYYDAKLDCGGSVSATEHSVMCAGGQDNELETFRHLIEDVYPSGIVSIVSDTWDLWKVLTDYVPSLKDKILARDGKVVIRPDSGDPVNIVCGDWPKTYDSISLADLEDNLSIMDPQDKGVLRLLAQAVGVTEREGMLPLINKMGCIYGDAINLDRADRMLTRCVQELKLSPFNQVFGIGSFAYEYVTRDTYGHAMKATAVRTADGKIVDIFKKPVTDDGIKNSLKGIPAVYRTEESTEEKPEYFVVEGATEEQLNNCAYQKVFSNGQLLVDHKFEDIRKRVRA